MSDLQNGIVLANKINFDGMGDRLKDARNAKKMTQETLANMIGVSWMTIFRWEHGQRSVPRGKAIVLAAALERTYDDLILPMRAELPVGPV